MKIGDIVLVRNEKLDAVGNIDYIEDNKISVATGVYDIGTLEFSIKVSGKVEIFKDCTLIEAEEASELLVKSIYRSLLEDEIYFFFNNDSKVDHLEPEIMDGATKILPLENLEKLVNIIIPYGRGEYKFTEIQQVKDKAKEISKKGSLSFLYLKGD